MLEINPASGKKRRRAEVLQIAANGEPKTVENAVIVPETDPERVAFNLWNEGKVDEAIQYLEREILSRKDHYEGHDGTTELKPISDWRDRHRALGAADFNAFGSSAHTIDLVAGPADAIVPHPPRRTLRPIWIIGICLAVIGISSAAAFWSTRAGAPDETALAAVEPTLVKEQPAAKAAAAPKPAPYIAAVGSNDATTMAKPVPTAAPDTDAAAADATPPDEAAAPSDLAADETSAPETTASIPATASSEASDGVEPAPPVVEARLPRQRPEPPAQPTRVARVDQQDPPTVYTPAQSGDAAPRFFDPNNPPPRLTPAEYQALIERRAWAENYVARRRAYAERRARLEEPDGWLGSPGPFVRLQND